MSNIFTERQALREYIEFLKEERRKISEEYWSSIQRLRELDEKFEKEHGLNPDIADSVVSKALKNIDVADVKEKILDKHIQDLIPVEKEEVESVIPEDVVKESMWFDDKSDRRFDRSKYFSTVSSFIKGFDRDVKLKEITNLLLTDYNVKLSNATQFMNDLMAKHKNVVRVSKGRYTHKLRRA